MKNELEVRYVPIDTIIPYENNPRDNDGAVTAVANSIREFGFKVPIIVDKDMTVIAGHTRLKAAQSLGLAEIPIVMASDLNEEQARAFRLADNKTSELAKWDFSKLEEELAELSGLDMSAFGFEKMDYDDHFDNYTDRYADGKLGSLSEKFVVPPFSVLDTTRAYWQDRKKAWKDRMGDLSETRNGSYGKVNGGSGLFDTISDGTSNFDPVLAEIVYKWFCPADGKVIDPFGGEQTKGVVAGELGLKYTAVEIRQEQVDLNREKVAKYTGVEYVCGDSNNIDNLIQGSDFDLCFTSPPYYDLEVYSADDLSSLGTYEEFMRQYKNIFKKCYDKLKEDSFLVVKVGEIRNKKTGVYRGFVSDNINIMNEIGFKYYNEIILVNAVGTGAIRASSSMRTRKVVKRHQNILVFYKGDPGNIAGKFTPILYDEEEIPVE